MLAAPLAGRWPLVQCPFDPSHRCRDPSCRPPRPRTGARPLDGRRRRPRGDRRAGAGAPPRGNPRPRRPRPEPTPHRSRRGGPARIRQRSSSNFALLAVPLRLPSRGPRIFRNIVVGVLQPAAIIDRLAHRAWDRRDEEWALTVAGPAEEARRWESSSAHGPPRRVQPCRQLGNQPEPLAGGPWPIPITLLR